MTSHENLKYYSNMVERGLTDCPGEDCYACERWAYHLLHLPIDPNKDFRPTLVQNPERELMGESLCFGFGLSMFETEGGLDRFWKSAYLTSKTKRAIGNQLHQINLRATDGVSSPSRKHGHFTFFEYCDFDHEGKYQFVKALPL